MNNKYCLDANILIQPWDNSYPIDVFPSLWPILASHRGDFILIKPIYDQIEPHYISDTQKTLSQRAKENPLRHWLTMEGFRETSVEKEVLDLSIKLEKEYETDDSRIGADRNDIMLISYAKINELPVVTLEVYQTSVPQKKRKYKIPLICEKENVECITYIELLKKCKVKV